MLQPSPHLLLVLRSRHQLQVSRLTLNQALPLYCDLSSPCLKLSLTSHLHGCLQAGHRAHLQLLSAEEERRLEEVVDQEEVGQRPWEALAEAEEVLSLAAWGAVEEGRHCLAWVAEEEPHCSASGEEGVPRCSAWAEEVGLTFLALVVAVGLRMWEAVVVGRELRQAVQAETMLVVEAVVLAAHCS